MPPLNHKKMKEFDATLKALAERVATYCESSKEQNSTREAASTSQPDMSQEIYKVHRLAGELGAEYDQEISADEFEATKDVAYDDAEYAAAYNAMKIT